MDKALCVGQLKDLEIAIEEDRGLKILCITTPLEDPDAVLVTHVWVDRAAHDSTTALEQARVASAQVLDLLAEPPVHSYADVALLRAFPS